MADKTLLRTTCLVGLLGLLPACGAGTETSGSDPGDPFQFQVGNAIPIEITITKNGVPLPGAAVSILAAYSGDTTGGDSAALAQGHAFFEGASEEDGVCRGEVLIPADAETVDIVVHHSGSKGPYTRETLRTLWGPTAPSSRVTVGPGAVTALAIDLEDDI